MFEEKKKSDDCIGTLYLVKDYGRKVIANIYPNREYYVGNGGYDVIQVGEDNPAIAKSHGRISSVYNGGLLGRIRNIIEGIVRGEEGKWYYEDSGSTHGSSVTVHPTASEIKKDYKKAKKELDKTPPQGTYQSIHIIYESEEKVLERKGKQKLGDHSIIRLAPNVENSVTLEFRLFR